MNLPKPKTVVICAAVFSTIIFSICCLGMLWEIFHGLFARLDGPSFSTEEMLASLGVMVTGLGLFIAMATAGIAVLAVFGVAELRAIAERKAREGLDQILAVMREKNLLDDDEFLRLQNTGIPVLNHSATNFPLQESVTEARTPATEAASNAASELSEYPEGKEDRPS